MTQLAAEKRAQFLDQSHQHLVYWTVIGTNYTRANTETRSRFALTHEQIDRVYAKAKTRGLRDFFILSTCNRTEFYGCAPREVMESLMVDSLHLHGEELQKYFYCWKGVVAIQHFFRVTAGLDSQIPGDYEIVAQVKKAVELARSARLIGTLTDRIFNFALQASKEVKTQTNLCSGKYSVSFAATEFLKSKCARGKSFLVIGTGMMGAGIAQQLRDAFPQCRLVLTNRTNERALHIQNELSAEVLPFHSFADYLSQFDGVVATAEADHHLVSAHHVSPNQQTIFLDLSIPCVIDPEIRQWPGTSLYTVDDVSVFHNDLLRHRQLEIPKAEQMVETYVARLVEWINSFYHRGIVLGYREKTKRLPYVPADAHPQIEQALHELIQKIRVEGYHGCSVIQAVNELIPLRQ